MPSRAELESDDRSTFLDEIERNGLEWSAGEDTLLTKPTLPYTTKRIARVADREPETPESGYRPDTPYLRDFPILTVGEKEEKLDDPYCESVRKSHRRNHYSPYRSREGTRRNVTVFEVMDTPFCEVRDGTHRTLVPAHVTAINGDPESEYVVKEEHRPVFLSCGNDGTGGDYEKFIDMDIDVGDNVVMISGRSNKSRIHKVPEYFSSFASLCSNLLMIEEHDGREEALQEIEGHGVEIGESGHVESNYDRVWDWATSKDFAEHGGGDKTEAQQLQKSVESGEKHFVHDLDHAKRWKLGCRLVRIGNRDTAYNWLREQCGPHFKPDVTNKFLDEIVGWMDKEKDHTDSAVTESFMD